METFFVFIAISASVTLGVQGFKNVYKEALDWICGVKTWETVDYSLFIAFALALFGVISYGTGLIAISGVVYPNLGLKIFDLITTGSMISMGSNTLYDWAKTAGKSVAKDSDTVVQRIKRREERKQNKKEDK